MLWTRNTFVWSVRNAKCFFQDLDGSYYKYTPEFDEHCDTIGAEVARQLVKELSPSVPLTEEEALEIKKRSLKKYGWGPAEFCNLFGIPTHKWHFEYHNRIDVDLTAPTPVTKEHLERCTVPMIIFSHANKGWIINYSEQRLGGYFAEENMLPLEKVGFNLKNNGGEAYREALGYANRLIAEKSTNGSCERAGVRKIRPYEVMLSDDSTGNLKSAKKAGWTTILITQGKLFKPEEHEYVDAAFSDMKACMEYVNRVRPNRSQRTPFIRTARCTL